MRITRASLVRVGAVAATAVASTSLALLLPVSAGAVGGGGEITPTTTSTTTAPTTTTTTAGSSTTTTTTANSGGTTTTNPGGPGIINTSCVFTKVVPTGTTYVLTVTCLFAPDSTVDITYDGQPYLSNVSVPDSGQLIETFTVTGDPEITMNGGAKESNAFGVTSTWVASGSNPEGGTNVATTFISTPNPGTGSGTLAFTGADLMATIIGGAILLLMGIALTVYARRRSERNSAAGNISI